MNKNKEKIELLDATGMPYKTKEKFTALVVYYEIPFEDPRKQLAPELPIQECTQVDIKKLDELKEKYNIVASVNSLQCIRANEVPNTIVKLASLLKLKGELYIIVPSFEWAAQQANSAAPHPLIHIMTCGTEKVPHRSVFTLQWLRLLTQQAHLVIRHAVPEIYKIQIDKENYQMVRNFVIGWKYDEFDPASAIDSPGDMAQLASE